MLRGFGLIWSVAFVGVLAIGTCLACTTSSTVSTSQKPNPSPSSPSAGNQSLCANPSAGYCQCIPEGSTSCPVVASKGVLPSVCNSACGQKTTVCYGADANCYCMDPKSPLLGGCVSIDTLASSAECSSICSSAAKNNFLVETFTLDNTNFCKCGNTAAISSLKEGDHAIFLPGLPGYTEDTCHSSLCTKDLRTFSCPTDSQGGDAPDMCVCLNPAIGQLWAGTDIEGCMNSKGFTPQNHATEAECAARCANWYAAV